VWANLKIESVYWPLLKYWSAKNRMKKQTNDAIRSLMPLLLAGRS
jgi:hypothetical protein